MCDMYGDICGWWCNPAKDCEDFVDDLSGCFGCQSYRLKNHDAIVRKEERNRILEAMTYLIDGTYNTDEFRAFRSDLLEWLQGWDKARYEEQEDKEWES